MMSISLSIHRDESTKECADDNGEDLEEEEDLEELVLGRRKRTLYDEKEPDIARSFFIDNTTNHDDKPNAAWQDDDDELVVPQQKKSRGLGNLRHQPLLEADRKTEYQKTVGETPSWAALPTGKDFNDNEELLLNTYNCIVKSEFLPKGIITMNKCKDLNHEQPSKRGIESCEFHPKAQIALAAASDCRLSLFQVDGKSNPKIHSFFTEQFPIECAHFLANGEEIVMTSCMRWFYSYDMITGEVRRIPNIKGIDDKRLGNFKVSPNGKHLLFFSSYGRMHLVSSTTKELIKTIKVNGIVNDAIFVKDGKQFLTFGNEGIVNIWDVRSQSCMHTFADEGCTNGTSIAMSADNNFIACGSTSGIVNMYDDSCFTRQSPKPIKTFKNIRTSVSTLNFNASSEILAMASSTTENAVKLIHVPSLTVFTNFPGFENKFLNFARTLSFSPNSGYFAIGNHKGRALLYRLEHYKSF